MDGRMDASIFTSFCRSEPAKPADVLNPSSGVTRGGGCRMDYHKIAQALMPPEDCAAFVFISFMSLVSF